MEQKVTDLQIVPIRPNNGHVGFASFVYNNSFYFSSMGIYTRPQGGYRLTYPVQKVLNNTFSTFYPINREVASAIEQVITEKYESVICPQTLDGSFCNE